MGIGDLDDPATPIAAEGPERSHHGCLDNRPDAVEGPLALYLPGDPVGHRAAAERLEIGHIDDPVTVDVGVGALFHPGGVPPGRVVIDGEVLAGDRLDEGEQSLDGSEGSQNHTGAGAGRPHEHHCCFFPHH
jgi:hypothetical protein